MPPASDESESWQGSWVRKGALEPLMREIKSLSERICEYDEWLSMEASAVRNMQWSRSPANNGPELHNSMSSRRPSQVHPG
jgi:hypothetical protein